MVAVSIGRSAKTFPSVRADQQRPIGFENFVFVLGVNNQVGEIKRRPDQVLAGIQTDPFLTAIIGAIKRTALRFDNRVDNLWLGRRNRERNPSVWLVRETLRRGGINLRPVLPAIAGLKQPTARPA